MVAIWGSRFWRSASLCPPRLLSSTVTDGEEEAGAVSKQEGNAFPRADALAAQDVDGVVERQAQASLLAVRELEAAAEHAEEGSVRLRLDDGRERHREGDLVGGRRGDAERRGTSRTTTTRIMR